MGRRTNPPALRYSYCQSSTIEMLGPSYGHSYNIQKKQALLSAFKLFAESHNCSFIQIKDQQNIRIFWISTTFRGFFWTVHLFANVSFKISYVLPFYRILHKLFGPFFKLRFHGLSLHYKSARKPIKQRGRFTSVASRFLRVSDTLNPKRRRRFQLNRFFFMTSALMHLGFEILNADILAHVIRALFLKHKRHWLIFRFLRNALPVYIDNCGDIEGLWIQISGKVNGRPRKRKRVFRYGPMSLQGIAKNIDYSFSVAVTKFGAFGIKVWLYKKTKHAI